MVSNTKSGNIQLSLVKGAREGFIKTVNLSFKVNLDYVCFFSSFGSGILVSKQIVCCSSIYEMFAVHFHGVYSPYLHTVGILIRKNIIKCILSIYPITNKSTKFSLALNEN